MMKAISVFAVSGGGERVLSKRCSFATVRRDRNFTFLIPCLLPPDS